MHQHPEGEREQPAETHMLRSHPATCYSDQKPSQDQPSPSSPTRPAADVRHIPASTARTAGRSLTAEPKAVPLVAVMAFPLAETGVAAPSLAEEVSASPAARGTPGQNYKRASVRARPPRSPPETPTRGAQ